MNPHHDVQVPEYAWGAKLVEVIANDEDPDEGDDLSDDDAEEKGAAVALPTTAQGACTCRRVAQGPDARPEHRE